MRRPGPHLKSRNGPAPLPECNDGNVNWMTDIGPSACEPWVTHRAGGVPVGFGVVDDPRRILPISP